MVDILVRDFLNRYFKILSHLTSVEREVFGSILSLKNVIGIFCYKILSNNPEFGIVLSGWQDLLFHFYYIGLRFRPKCRCTSVHLCLALLGPQAWYFDLIHVKYPSHDLWHPGATRDYFNRFHIILLLDHLPHIIGTLAVARGFSRTFYFYQNIIWAVITQGKCSIPLMK